VKEQHRSRRNEIQRQKRPRGYRRAVKTSIRLIHFG
jgi:hypothetical protein